jgi:snurportin-1
LTLGGDSDDDDDTTAHPPPLGVAHFADLLRESEGIKKKLDTSIIQSSTVAGSQTTSQKQEVHNKRPKRRRRNKNKPSKWADKCMYAELLEMASDTPWSTSNEDPLNDGLPSDLESGWVAVGPVPAGKRCLAVTHQSSGIAGVGEHEADV